LVSRVFISYSHEDAATAEAIAAQIAQLGLGVWIDKEEVRPGDSFLGKMDEGLAGASYLVLLVSASSSQSRWVRREWMAALASKGTVVLPALLPDGEMPPLLRDIVYLDFRSDREAGLKQLAKFFQRELEQAGPPDLAESTRGPVGPLSAREARLVAINCITEYHFLSFLNDTKMSPGEIGGSSLNERIINLLHAVSRRGVLQQFVSWMADEDPHCFDFQLNRVRSERQWRLDPGLGTGA
jgi:hypothetical protein